MSTVIVDGVGVTVALLGVVQPQPVQIVITGVTAGDAVTVRGVAGGSSWAVPGGVFTSTGEQVVLVDNRAPINIPVAYEVTVGGSTVTSTSVTVGYDGARQVLQSLDGRTVVDFVWRDNGLPMEPVLRSVAFDVPGRARPPARFAAGGDGGGSLSIRTNAAGTAALLTMLKTGRPLVLRTGGAARDFPAVELLLIQVAPNSLFGAINAREDRVWNLPYLLVDDPEPGTVMAGSTWDDFDAAFATWDDFDAYFAGQDWDAFDRVDWTQF